MSNFACCIRPAGPVRTKRSWRRLASLVLPTTMLLIMPKCPVCFAGWFAVLAGIGISFTTAWYLRMGIVVLCLLWIGLLLLYLIRRLLFRSTHVDFPRSADLVELKVN